MRPISAISALVLITAFGVVYEMGRQQGPGGHSVALTGNAEAAQAGSTPESENFSRTGPGKSNLFYYPGTEALKPDEMRVTACGSGMPLPRLSQAAPCFLVELGNGDKFVFDIGTGSTERLMSLQIPLDYINKVFIGHLHMDHMGDLPAFFLYGPQNGRLEPLHVWGPGGGGSPEEWGMKASMEHMDKMWAWMQGTLVGTIDTRSFELHVTEFDWTKVNNVIYERERCGDPDHSRHPFRAVGELYPRMERPQVRLLERHRAQQVVGRAHQGRRSVDPRVLFHRTDVSRLVPVHPRGGVERQHTDPHLGADVRQDHVDHRAETRRGLSLQQRPGHACR